MIVVLANAFFMLALLYFMCSETCKENKDNVVLKEIRNRTSSMQLSVKRISGLGKTQRLERHATHHFRNPSMDAHLKGGAGGEYNNNKNNKKAERTRKKNKTKFASRGAEGRRMRSRNEPARSPNSIALTVGKAAESARKGCLCHGRCEQSVVQ